MLHSERGEALAQAQVAREAVEAPSLKVYKARLGEALRNLT